MKKSKQVPKMKVKTCINTKCPHHKVILDPDPYDWFCDDDVAVVCTLARKRKVKPNSLHASERQPFKIVTCACRPYMAKVESVIPKWCPLLKKNKKA
jgi:hypothetical protein